MGTISAFAYRHRETKKNLCRGEKPVSRWETCVEVRNPCRGEKPVSRWETRVEVRNPCRGDKPVSRWETCVEVRNLCWGEKPVSRWKTCVELHYQFESYTLAQTTLTYRQEQLYCNDCHCFKRFEFVRHIGTKNWLQRLWLVISTSTDTQRGIKKHSSLQKKKDT